MTGSAVLDSAMVDLSTSTHGAAAPLSHESLHQRYNEVRARTERLAAPLSPEDQVVQSMPDTSPTKWHRAYTTWFFAEFVLGADGTGSRPWDGPAQRFLYNSYYEAVGARHPRPNRGLVTRPSVAEVVEYRRYVDDEMAELFASELTPEQHMIIELGTHHEEQHQELLLLDIKHMLSMNPAIGPAYADRVSAGTSDPGPAAFLPFEGGTVEVGATGEGFSFDHEGPRHETRIYPFALADRLVTAGEWMEFIDDGGYRRPEYWKSDGWYRSQSEGWDAPLYWRRSPDVIDEWWLHSLTGLRAVDPNEPVCHVSHYEAEAFAAWADARLPTEFEWEYAASEEVRRSGDRSATIDGRVLDEQDPTFMFHPSPAAHNDGPVLRQLFGDTWEWTSSAYEPYPRFEASAGAIGEYNGKFMSGQQVLRGGGAFTPPGHTRLTYRNFFHPHTRWHLGGVRLARTV